MSLCGWVKKYTWLGFHYCRRVFFIRQIVFFGKNRVSAYIRGHNKWKKKNVIGVKYIYFLWSKSKAKRGKQKRCRKTTFDILCDKFFKTARSSTIGSVLVMIFLISYFSSFSTFSLESNFWKKYCVFKMFLR